MSATPTNKINQDLLIGGDLGADNVVASVSVTTPALVGSVANGIITPNGAGFGFLAFEVAADLDTTGATTTIALPANTLPAGAIVWGGSVYVIDAVAGVNSTTLDVKVTGDQGGGAAATVVATVATPFPAGDAAALALFPPLSVTVADTILVVLSGGVDNTPTGGRVRIAVTYYRASPLTS